MRPALLEQPGLVTDHQEDLMGDGQNRKTGPPPTRHGYEAHEAVSALQKAIRRSEPDAALLNQHTLRGKKMGRGRKHFIQEASRLEPWTGSLDQLEREYRHQAGRRAAKDATLPQNSWARPTGGKPAHNSHPGSSG